MPCKVCHKCPNYKECGNPKAALQIRMKINQAMGFSRQEYWSGLPFPSPEDLPDPGIKPRSPALQADTLPTEPPGKQA